MGGGVGGGATAGRDAAGTVIAGAELAGSEPWVGDAALSGAALAGGEAAGNDVVTGDEAAGSEAMLGAVIAGHALGTELAPAGSPGTALAEIAFPGTAFAGTGLAGIAFAGTEAAPGSASTSTGEIPGDPGSCAWLAVSAPPGDGTGKTDAGGAPPNRSLAMRAIAATRLGSSAAGTATGDAAAALDTTPVVTPGLALASAPGAGGGVSGGTKPPPTSTNWPSGPTSSWGGAKLRSSAVIVVGDHLYSW